MMLRPYALNRSANRNKIYNNNMLLGSQTSPLNLSIQEINDGLVLDSVALSSFPNSQNSKLGQLRHKGLYIDVVDRGSKEDFNVIISEDSDYELRTLENVNMRGFHARSSIVFPKVNGVSSSKPSSLRIAFGGTKQWTDVPRTAAMYLTKRPFTYEKETNEFLDSTLKKYKDTYGDEPNVIVVAAHSAGTSHAIKAYKLLQDKEVKSDMRLRLYEPFGLDYTGFQPQENENVATYISEKSFLPSMSQAGKVSGHTQVLPAPSREKVENGSWISAAGRAISTPIMAHLLLWMVDSHLDKNNSSHRESSSSLESILSFESMQKLEGSGMLR